MSRPLTRHAGDVELTITTPPAQRQPTATHLDQYLPGPLGGHPMGAYHFTAHPGPAITSSAIAAWTPHAQASITPVPGVTLTETTVPDGRRRYTVASDTLEHRPGAWAAQVSGKAIDLYAADPHRMPRYLLRLIREVMLREYENSGGIVFHAAGAALPGGAVMICGPPGSGKTSTLAAILSQARQRSALLSNDRLIAMGHRLIAVPLPVPLARGTLEAVPNLRAACPAPVDDMPLVFGTRDKTALAALGFACAFGAGLTPAATARLLIVPHLVDSNQPPLIERLSPAQALQVLDTSCFTPTDEFWRPWLVPRTRPDEHLAQAAHTACAHLAHALACHRVTFGIRRPIESLTSALSDLIGELLP